MATKMRGRKSPSSFLVSEEAPPLLSCVLLLEANELCLFMDQLIHKKEIFINKYSNYISPLVLAFSFYSILKGYIVLHNNL